MSNRLLPGLVVLLASGSVARESGQSTGSAIAPRVAVSSVSTAGATSVVRVCLSNGNAGSRSTLLPGDSFVFSFGAGDATSCTIVPAEPHLGALDDWTCTAEGANVSLAYGGIPMTWPSAAITCIDIGWAHAGQPTSMQATTAVSTGGRMSPVEPSVTVVAPQLPSGADRAERLYTESTGVAIAEAGFGPVPIPGLEGTLALAESDQLMLHVEVQRHVDCLGATTPQVSNVVLYVDGLRVASRRLVHENSLSSVVVETSQTLSWLSPPLTAGSHHFSAMIEVDEIATAGRSGCIGHASDPDLVARAIAVVLR